MKIFLKMWCGLFLVAMMGRPGMMPASAAAADGQKDLESAFQAMSRQVSVSKVKPVPPLAAPEEEWQELLSKIREKGVFERSDSDMPPSTFGFEHKSASEDAAHVANYVNVWGSVDAAGIFHPDFVTLISEDWRIGKDGHWHIDCWRFRTDLYGQVSDSSYAKLAKKREGTMLPQGKVKRPAPAKFKAKYKALLKFWLLFEPSVKKEDSK